mmetsp:Transcript_29496/g.44820  ORF Transcript_29496/g.44820 Transcript_29496/m.44820 type:complete len:140 (+) Transcript_29496:2351-2770(+)
MWTLSIPEIFPGRVLVYEAATRVKYYYVEQLSILEHFYNPRVVYHLLLFGSTIAVFFLLEPLAREIAKACCFKPPRRGQRTRHGTLRSYGIESSYQAKYSDGFFFDMMKIKKYRRALLLLNQQNIDEADDQVDRQENED